jgi:hypothetical protein
VHACYEAAVENTNKPSFAEEVILKDWYREQGPNRVNLVMF